MVENERKFVLPLNYAIPSTWKRSDIYQYYLPNGTRLRAENVETVATYTLCNKTAIASGGWNEQETTVTLQHFMNYARYATHSVIKTRYSQLYNDELWCIDYYSTQPDSAPYFVLAECEMPEQRSTPLYNPLSTILYCVPPEEQLAYSAKQLSDVRYATTLLKELDYGS